MLEGACPRALLSFLSEVRSEGAGQAPNAAWFPGASVRFNGVMLSTYTTLSLSQPCIRNTRVRGGPSAPWAPWRSGGPALLNLRGTSAGQRTENDITMRHGTPPGQNTGEC